MSVEQLHAPGSLTIILLTWTKWRAPTNASKWRMGFNSAFKGLTTEKSSWYPQNWRQGGSYSRFERVTNETILVLQSGNETPCLGRQAPNLDTVPTELSRVYRKLHDMEYKLQFYSDISSRWCRWNCSLT